VCVLPLFLTGGFALTFLFALTLDARLDIAMRAISGVLRGVLHVSPRLLRFAFHLLRCAFHLGAGIACPFAHLALYPSCRVVDCTFYLIIIHEFTSTLWLRAYSVVPPASSASGEMLAIRRSLQLDRPSARDQLDEQHNKSDHEKDVNESPQGVRRNYAQQPQH
jgi:hypothetical protein